MPPLLPLRQVTSGGMVLLLALCGLHVTAAGDSSPSTGTAARIQRLARAEEFTTKGGTQHAFARTGRAMQHHHGLARGFAHDQHDRQRPRRRRRLSHVDDPPARNRKRTRRGGRQPR